MVEGHNCVGVGCTSGGIVVSGGKLFPAAAAAAAAATSLWLLAAVPFGKKGVYTATALLLLDSLSVWPALLQSWKLFDELRCIIDLRLAIEGAAFSVPCDRMRARTPPFKILWLLAVSVFTAPVQQRNYYITVSQNDKIWNNLIFTKWYSWWITAGRW